jgi:hypothetical protein
MPVAVIVPAGAAVLAMLLTSWSLQRGEVT